MNCKGEYINVDPSNALCVDDLKAVTKVSDTTLVHIKKYIYIYIVRIIIK